MIPKEKIREKLLKEQIADTLHNYGRIVRNSGRAVVMEITDYAGFLDALANLIEDERCKMGERVRHEIFGKLIC